MRSSCCRRWEPKRTSSVQQSLVTSQTKTCRSMPASSYLEVWYSSIDSSLWHMICAHTHGSQADATSRDIRHSWFCDELNFGTSGSTRHHRIECASITRSIKAFPAVATGCRFDHRKCSVWALVYGLCNYLDDNGRTLLLQQVPLKTLRAGLHCLGKHAAHGSRLHTLSIAGNEKTNGPLWMMQDMLQ